MRAILLSLALLLISCCSPIYTLHPVMRGDCVDRVVSICEQLRKKGYQARIVLGYIEVDGKKQAHAWVEYRKNEKESWKIYANY